MIEIPLKKKYRTGSYKVQKSTSARSGTNKMKLRDPNTPPPIPTAILSWYEGRRQMKLLVKDGEATTVGKPKKFHNDPNAPRVVSLGGGEYCRIFHDGKSAHVKVGSDEFFERLAALGDETVQAKALESAGVVV